MVTILRQSNAIKVYYQVSGEGRSSMLGTNMGYGENFSHEKDSHRSGNLFSLHYLTIEVYACGPLENKGYRRL